MTAISMKKLIIKTSDLGYDESAFEIFTNYPLEEFFTLDLEFGHKNSNDSTRIEHLIHGIMSKGYIIVLLKTLYQNSPHNPKIKADYYARSGNY